MGHKPETCVQNNDLSASLRTVSRQLQRVWRCPRGLRTTTQADPPPPAAPKHVAGYPNLARSLLFHRWSSSKTPQIRNLRLLL